MVVTSELYGVRVLGVGENDISSPRPSCSSPMAWATRMTFPLWTGSTAILDDRRPTPDNTFENIETLQADALFRRADALRRPAGGARQPSREARQHPRLRLGGRAVAGRHLPPLEGEDRHGDPRRHRLDRVLHIFIGNRLDDYRPGTSGKPVPGYEARSLDNDGKPVEKGESRRLVDARASRRADTTGTSRRRRAETMVDGWLNTGDTYREDPDGYLVYEGRNDDMMKVGGIWCSPIEIESCLITHPAVLEAAVVGQADADQLIKPKADRGAERPGDAAVRRYRGAGGALQEQPGALQVPALDRVRGRAAQDGDRQDPALQAEGMSRADDRFSDTGSLLAMPSIFGSIQID